MRVVDALFPAQCGGCGAVGSGFCDLCAMQTRGASEVRGRLRVRALGEYRGGLRSAVLAVKDGRRDVAQALGVRLARLLPPAACVVPVPTTAARRRARGMDGVAVMARAAATACDAGVVAALVRAGSAAQQGRTRSARLAAHGRFVCVRPAGSPHAILLDDVCTTGATLLDCAAALDAAGTHVTEAVVVAIAPNDDGP